jgi:hypothetical protein
MDLQSFGQDALRRPRKHSRARLFLGIAALLLIVVFVHLLIERIFYPWASPLTGDPRLTGQWLGEMTLPSGRKQWLWLKLTHPLPTGKCNNCPTIEGGARTCSPGTGPLAYRVWGRTENRRGTSFYVKTLEQEERRGEPVLGTLQGAWAQDTVDLSTQLIVRGEPTTIRWEKDASGKETQTVIGGSPEARVPIEWRMQRGTESEFEQRCASSAQRGR